MIDKELRSPFKKKRKKYDFNHDGRKKHFPRSLKTQFFYQSFGLLDSTNSKYKIILAFDAHTTFRGAISFDTYLCKENYR